MRIIKNIFACGATNLYCLMSANPTSLAVWENDRLWSKLSALKVTKTSAFTKCFKWQFAKSDALKKLFWQKSDIPFISSLHYPWMHIPEKAYVVIAMEYRSLVTIICSVSALWPSFIRTNYFSRVVFYFVWINYFSRVVKFQQFVFYQTLMYPSLTKWKIVEVVIQWFLFTLRGMDWRLAKKYFEQVTLRSRRAYVLLGAKFWQRVVFYIFEIFTFPATILMWFAKFTKPSHFCSNFFMTLSSWLCRTLYTLVWPAKAKHPILINWCVSFQCSVAYQILVSTNCVLQFD